MNSDLFPAHRGGFAVGRPAGEVRQALMRACAALAGADRGPTLQELAEHACVARDVARRTLDNLRRAGLLTVPRTRRVPYRNRPVAEYVPKAGWVSLEASPIGLMAVAEQMQAWRQ